MLDFVKFSIRKCFFYVKSHVFLCHTVCSLWEFEQPITNSTIQLNFIINTRATSSQEFRLYLYCFLFSTISYQENCASLSPTPNVWETLKAPHQFTTRHKPPFLHLRTCYYRRLFALSPSSSVWTASGECFVRKTKHYNALLNTW